MKTKRDKKANTNRRKDKDWPYPGGYNHVLGYCEGKPYEAGEGMKVVSLDKVIKDGRSLNK